MVVSQGLRTWLTYSVRLKPIKSLTRKQFSYDYLVQKVSFSRKVFTRLDHWNKTFTNLTRRDFVFRDTSDATEDGPGSPCEFEVRERFSLLVLDFESVLEISLVLVRVEVRLDDRLRLITGLVSSVESSPGSTVSFVEPGCSSTALDRDLVWRRSPNRSPIRTDYFSISLNFKIGR